MGTDVQPRYHCCQCHKPCYIKMCIGCTQQLQQSMPSSGNTDVPPLAAIIPHAIPISIPTLLCFCGNEVAVRVVKKEGRNQGRRFFCCAQLPGRRRCEFFEWHADDSARPFHAGDGSSVFAGTALAPAGLIPEPAQWIPQGSEKPTISNSCTDAAPLQAATSTGSLATDHRGAGMAVNAKRKREARPNFEKELRPTEWNLAELRQVCERHGISAGGVRKPVVGIYHKDHHGEFLCRCPCLSMPWFVFNSRASTSGLAPSTTPSTFRFSFDTRACSSSAFNSSGSTAEHRLLCTLSTTCSFICSFKGACSNGKIPKLI